jgi:hypothetical protein
MLSGKCLNAEFPAESPRAVEYCESGILELFEDEVRWAASDGIPDESCV